MFLARFSKSLLDRKVAFAIVGGYAVSFHGAPRGTFDIDIVLKHSENCFVECEQALNELGLVSKLPVSAEEVFQFREEYIKNRNLIAWSFSNPSNPLELIDIVLTHDLSNLKTKKVEVEGVKIPILSIEDLITMKESSGRKQDLEDVRVLKELK